MCLAVLKQLFQRWNTSNIVASIYQVPSERKSSKNHQETLPRTDRRIPIGRKGKETRYGHV